MSPATEIRLITLRELRRNIRSGKGIALGALTLLGASAASFVCVWLEGLARSKGGATSTEAYVELKKQAYVQLTHDDSLAAYLANIPTSLMTFLWITVWLSPLLVALLGFDAVSGELQHRSVRFWTVRARRSSYVVGKLVALWLLMGGVTLALNLMAGMVALTRGYITVSELVTWGTRLWLVAFVIAGAWTAVATFISSCFKTPILALLTTFGTFFVSWMIGVGGSVAHFGDSPEAGLGVRFPWYKYVYPNAYDVLLLSPEAPSVLKAVGILVGAVAILAVAAALLFERRDI